MIYVLGYFKSNSKLVSFYSQSSNTSNTCQILVTSQTIPVTTYLSDGLLNSSYPCSVLGYSLLLDSTTSPTSGGDYSISKINSNCELPGSLTLVAPAY
jgi:hypothetical protein